MSTQVIDPDYNWKQAAAQESVDYDAVKKAFMDQAYGFVANKAKVLFQDPFRLGFEIVHRNEKATKMIGIFVFRCGGLLYVPVFYVNGEIKAADMLYRDDVKRFVPLTDEWCAFLVQGANQEGGQMVDKSRQRQPDAYMDRLAYPQRVKYASDQGILRELLSHCAKDDEPRLLIPDLINDFGPDAMNKLASFIENSDIARKVVATNYTVEQLTDVSGWQSKQAAAEDIYENAVVVEFDPDLCKSASAREDIMTRGYTLVDNRPAGATNTIIKELENNTITELAAPCEASVLMSDGSFEDMLLLRHDHNLGTPNRDRGTLTAFAPDSYDGRLDRKPNMLYSIKDKECVDNFTASVFGDEAVGQTKAKFIKPADVTTGKTYLLVDPQSMTASEPLYVAGIDHDGACDVISAAGQYGGTRKLFYAPGRKSRNDYISDDVAFLEIDADVERYESPVQSASYNVSRVRPKWTRVLMDATGIDSWMRTAGGSTTSTDVEVRKHGDLFSVTSQDITGHKKVASDLGMLEAHIKLAHDFEMTCDAAGKILTDLQDDSVKRVRIYDTVEKSAFATRMQNMYPWIQSWDPQLNVKLDAPQKQVIKTFTPQRQKQVSRYGDHWSRPPFTPKDPDDDGLPADALMTKSPEELAQLSKQYNMPHIFDHGALGQMATSMFNTVSQIQKYVPDLETGVDRYFRILFLLRYRPADFEEAYGKDELQEMEQEIGELAALAGENLLRMLKRFDRSKYSVQSLSNQSA